MKIRNVSGVARDIAATGQTVDDGDEVEVPDELGRSLCEQAVNWEAVKKAPAKTSKTDEEGEG